MLTPDDPYALADFDGCWDGSEPTGWTEAWSWIRSLNSYSEWSPSGRGVHVIVRATLDGPGRNNQQLHVEIYDRARFVTVTGRPVGDTPRPIVERQAVLTALYATLTPVRSPSSNGAVVERAGEVGSVGTDLELLERAREARNGAAFHQLYRGDWEQAFPSQSEAELSLCNHLAFWVGPDPARIDRLFRGSGLMRPKWDEPRNGTTYGAQTIEKALSGRGPADFYSPKSTERTERSVKPPVHEENPRSVEDRPPERTETERLAERKPPELAQEPQILDKLDELVGELGLIGERHIARAVYLTHISRLLPVPGRQVTKGDSSSGKSYATECSLEAAAPEFLYVRTSTSALALFYTEESLSHKTLVFYEANKLDDEDDDLARVVRTLLSENQLKHEVTDQKKMRTVLLEKEGPVAFLSTVARPTLDPEIETRILSLHTDSSDEQTAAVVESLLNAAADPADSPDVSEWHALDRWLASHGPTEVVVPWARALASFRLSGPPRLRRDITNLLSLAKAHAVLHRASRETDPRGRVIANLNDYEVVRALLSDALAIATDKAVRPGTRKIVDAVKTLRAQQDEVGKQKPISLKAAARRAGRSPSTTHTDAHDALARGYLINRSTGGNRFDLDIGDPLPTESELLPSKAELAQVMERSAVNRSVTVRSSVQSDTERENPVTAGISGDRSVCSVDSAEEGYSANASLDEWLAEHPELFDEQAS